MGKELNIIGVNRQLTSHPPVLGSGFSSEQAYHIITRHPSAGVCKHSPNKESSMHPWDILRGLVGRTPFIVEKASHEKQQ